MSIFYDPGIITRLSETLKFLNQIYSIRSEHWFSPFVYFASLLLQFISFCSEIGSGYVRKVPEACSYRGANRGRG